MQLLFPASLLPQPAEGACEALVLFWGGRPAGQPLAGPPGQEVPKEEESRRAG